IETSGYLQYHSTDRPLQVRVEFGCGRLVEGSSEGHSVEGKSLNLCQRRGSSLEHSADSQHLVDVDVRSGYVPRGDRRFELPRIRLGGRRSPSCPS
ncbi:hypothetical protein PFISCL1PPCAC_513, partial [Pristionchus fissidentatus]